VKDEGKNNKGEFNAPLLEIVQNKCKLFDGKVNTGGKSTSRTDTCR